MNNKKLFFENRKQKKLLFLVFTLNVYICINIIMTIVNRSNHKCTTIIINYYLLVRKIIANEKYKIQCIILEENVLAWKKKKTLTIKTRQIFAAGVLWSVHNIQYYISYYYDKENTDRNSIGRASQQRHYYYTDRWKFIILSDSKMIYI